MTPRDLAIGERIRAAMLKRSPQHAQWAWLAGMKCQVKVGGAYRLCTVLWVPPGRLNPASIAYAGVGPVLGCAEPQHLIPDASHPETRGLLLALNRRLWGDPGIYIETADNGSGGFGWAVLGWSTWHTYQTKERAPYRPLYSPYPAEDEALVAALEHAPIPTTSEVTP